MVKTYISSILLTTALFISGCGVDGDTCAAQVSIDLDEESFTKVIDSLENNQTCSDSFTNEEAWLNLGAAYIGEAGISVGKILGSIAGLTDANSLGAILSAFDSASTTAGLQYLTDAQTVYGYILSGQTCGDAGNSDFVEAACTYAPIAASLKTIGILNATMGGIVDLIGAPITTGGEFDVDDNAKADETQATQCAILTGSGACADGNVSVTASASKTFTNAAQNFSASYVPARYTIADIGAASPATAVAPFIDGNDGNSNVYNKLIDPVNGPITTSGRCKVDFSSCTSIDNTVCFACPVLIDGATISTTEGILDAVNNDTVDPNVKNALDTDGDGTVTNIELAAGMSAF